MNITKWIANGRGRVIGGDHAITVARAICNTTTGLSVQQYLNRTQAWRPLELHPDWLTWPGATTKGNNK